LTDQQDLPSCLLNRPVHDSLVIIENAQARNLSAQPFDVFRRVGLFNTEQNNQPLRNGSLRRSVYRDAPLGDPLNDGAHQIK
jgi:hypothetical protein